MLILPPLCYFLHNIEAAGVAENTGYFPFITL